MQHISQNSALLRPTGPSLHQTLESYFERGAVIGQRPFGPQKLPSCLFFCNEKVTPSLLSSAYPGILGVGGDLIGCGVGMSLQLAQYAQSDRVFIIDNDPAVQLLLWPITISHFFRSPSRLDFIESLLLDSFTEAERATLAMASPDEIFAFAVNSDRKSGLKDNADIFLQRLTSALLPHINEQFDAAAIRKVALGLTLGVRASLGDFRVSDVRHPEYFDPVLSYKVAASGPFLFPQPSTSFLTDESTYAYTRNLVLSPRLAVHFGDLMGQELLDVVVNHCHGTPPRVIYVDKVPSILAWNDYSGAYQRGMTNLSKLLGDQTTVVYSARRAADKGVQAAVISSKDYRDIDFFRALGEKVSCAGNDYPGIKHSALLENSYLLRHGENSEQRWRALNETLEGQLSSVNMGNFLPVLRSALKELSWQFDSRTAFWEYMRGKQDSRTSGSEYCGLNHFDAFLVERALELFGAISVPEDS